jgi:hypothetical protein
MKFTFKVKKPNIPLKIELLAWETAKTDEEEFTIRKSVDFLYKIHLMNIEAKIFT